MKTKINKTGFKALQNRMNRLINDELNEANRVALKRASGDLAMVASEMAPRDTGTLEQNIKAKEVTRNGFISTAEVYVDPSPLNEKAGYTLGEYMVDAHESITPAGGKNLGPRSVEKDSGIGGKFAGEGVGGWFMTRALQYLKQNIINQVKTEVLRAIKASKR